MPSYFVRLGALAEIRRANGSLKLTRGQRIIVRSERGVELAEVSAECPRSQPTTSDSGDVGSIAQVASLTVLRPTTEQDELLIRRLDRHKRIAVEACRTAIANAGSPAVLLEVDHLLDGGTLLMHFLGPVDPLAERITSEIVESYEEIVRSRYLAKLLHDGCGPDCGTDETSGCGGSCIGCGVASICATRPHNEEKLA